MNPRGGRELQAGKVNGGVESGELRRLGEETEGKMGLFEQMRMAGIGWEPMVGAECRVKSKERASRPFRCKAGGA